MCEPDFRIIKNNNLFIRFNYKSNVIFKWVSMFYRIATNVSLEAMTWHH